jgi:hypothetical protein
MTKGQVAKPDTETITAEDWLGEIDERQSAPRKVSSRKRQRYERAARKKRRLETSRASLLADERRRRAEQERAEEQSIRGLMDEWDFRRIRLERERIATRVGDDPDRLIRLFTLLDQACSRRERSRTAGRLSNKEIAESLRGIRVLIGRHDGNTLMGYIRGVIDGSIERRGRPWRPHSEPRGFLELERALPAEIHAGGHPTKKELALILRGWGLLGLAGDLGDLSAQRRKEVRELLLYAARVLDGSIERRGRTAGKVRQRDDCVTAEWKNRRRRHPLNCGKPTF